VHLREYTQLGFCCSGLRHASVEVLFEGQVGVPPDSQPWGRLFLELDEAVSYLYIGCEFGPQVLLVASPECEMCCLHHCSDKLDISSAGPLDGLCCAALMFFDHLVQVVPGCHPSKVVYKAEAFGLDSLFHPLYQSSSVYHKENW